MKSFKYIVIVLFSVLCTGISTPARTTGPLKVSILGDSYSTFEGWSYPEWNAIWYFSKDSKLGSQPNDVKEVGQTWWYQVIAEMGWELERNNSFSGATICNTGYKDMSGVNQDYSDRAFFIRANDLGHPDVILVCGGTNDSWAGAEVGEYKWKKWSNEDLHNFRPAMAKVCSELRTLYPQARVVFILNSELRDEINESVHKICDRYRIQCIDLHNIDKQSGHPSQAGMKAFADQVVEALR